MPENENDEIEYSCSVCELKKDESSIFNKNVEGSEYDLCGKCGIEYQIKWRPDYSPTEPNVSKFVEFKKKRFSE